MPLGRIMIVEDESLVAVDLHTSLERSGYEVVGTADTFDSAAELAVDTRPDLVLLDIRLKGSRDGIDLAHELRRRRIGFVYLTSHSDDRTLSRAEITEPLGYVLKPFGTRELVPVVQTAMYRHAAEQRLRGLENWLSAVLRSIGDAVVVTDAAARVTYLNPRAERLIGLDLRSAAGRPLAELVSLVDVASNRPLECPAMRSIRLKTTLTIDADTELVREDGERVPVEDSAAPILDDAGQVDGVVVVLRDATPRRLLEQNQREADRRLRDAERLESISMLATGLAHDLNNMLTVILGNVSLCRGGGGSADQQETLRDIETTARAAGDLCRRMLTNARARPPQVGVVDVGEVAAECIAAERSMWRSAVRFDCGVPPGALFVSADRVQFRQVLHNLLHNACEAMSTDGGHLTVRAVTVKFDGSGQAGNGNGTPRELGAGDYVRIDVIDDGPGMPAEVAARVFEPFFTTKTTGTGLGLASAKAVVRRHGGAIELETELCSGTSFRVWWPAAPFDVSAIRESATTNGRVLIIDDDDDLRRVTARLLEANDFTCHQAASAVQALALLAGGVDVDVLIVDVGLGGVSAFDLLAGARSMLPKLPVLFLSSALVVDHPSLQDPTVAFLAKPFSIEQLRTALQRVMRRAGRS